MAYNGFIAEIPVGFGGLTGSRNQAQIRPDQLLVATNISYDTGNISKEGGATRYNATAIAGSPSILGGWDWLPSDGVQRMVVVTSDGKILRDDGLGTFGTTLKSGLDVTGPAPFFVEGGKEAATNNRKLFVFTGKNPVQVIDGDAATSADIGTPPADWTAATQPTFGLIHEDRLWGGGNNNDPHRLYYSTVGNHGAFTGAGSGTVSVFPGEGERLVAAISFKGFIVAFKYPRGIYLVDTTDPAISNWKVKPLTRAVGTVSALSAILTDDDIMFLDASGNFQLISATTEFGDMGNRNLSVAAQLNTFMRANINFAHLTKAQAIYYSHKREVHFAIPRTSSTVNDCRIVADFNGELPRFRFSDRDINPAMWLRKDSDSITRVMIGSNDGFVHQLDGSIKSKDGSPYTASFQTAHMDLAWVDPSLANRRKIGQFLECVVEPTGNWNLSCDIVWDNKLQETVQFNMGESGVALGSFVLGTDRLGGGAVLNRRARISGSGQRISIVGRNSAANEDFSIARFYLYFKVGDERHKN